MPIILTDGIIQNYLAGLKLKQQHEHTKVEEGLQKEAGSRAQEQLTGYLAHLKAEEAATTARHELEKTRVGYEGAAHRLQATTKIAEMTASGAYDPTGKNREPVIGGAVAKIGDNPANTQTFAQGAGDTPQEPYNPIDLGGGIVIDPRNFTSYAGMQQQKVNQARALGGVTAETAGAITTAVQKAEEPFDVTKSERALKQATEVEAAKAKDARLLKEQADKTAKELQTQRDAAALERVNKTNEGRRAAAGIGAAARMYAADKSHAVDQEAVTNNAIIHATGQGGAPLNNTTNKPEKLILNKLGLVEFAAKDATKLKEVHAMDPLYDEMRNFVKELPETQAGAMGQKLIGAIPTTMVANFNAKIRGVSGNVSKTMGGESGKLAEGDVDRALGLLVKGGITKEQAIDRITFFEQNTKSKVSDQILGGQNDKQKLLNLLTYDFDPNKFNKPVMIGGKGFKKKDGTLHTIFEKDPEDGEWRAFDPKAKGYVRVDHGR